MQRSGLVTLITPISFFSLFGLFLHNAGATAPLFKVACIVTQERDAPNLTGACSDVARTGGGKKASVVSSTVVRKASTQLGVTTRDLEDVRNVANVGFQVEAALVLRMHCELGKELIAASRPTGGKKEKKKNGKARAPQFTRSPPNCEWSIVRVSDAGVLAHAVFEPQRGRIPRNEADAITQTIWGVLNAEQAPTVRGADVAGKGALDETDYRDYNEYVRPAPVTDLQSNAPASSETLASTPTAATDQPQARRAYVGVGLRATSAQGGAGMMAGARFGIHMRRGFALGVAGYYTVITPAMPQLDTLSLVRLRPGYTRPRGYSFGYGGLELAYALGSPRSLAHLRFSMLGGAGIAGHEALDGKGAYVGADAIWVIEPGAEVVINVADSWHLVSGAHYRWVKGLSLAGVPLNSDHERDELDSLGVDFGIVYGIY